MAITDRLSALTPEQRALFEKLREQQRKQKPPAVRAPQPPPIERRAPEGSAGATWPLSFDQERLWFLYMLNPRDTSYNIDSASQIRGPLDFAALAQAFQETAKRHEIWRTAFPAVDGRPVQVVLPEMHLPSGIVDLRALPRERRTPAAHALMTESTLVPFALETGPLAKALLLRMDDEDCIVHLVVHHIVTDWVTFQLFWREIGLLYEAFVAGRPSPLPPPAVQYADYTVWQRDWMRGEVEEHFLRYWVEHLRGAPLALAVPTDRPRPPVMTSRGDRLAVRVERAAELKALARREGLTPFMIVLAAYQLVLARWSGADKVIVGSPNANRNRIEIQEIFGFFLTQLPFCTDFSGDPTLREALRRTRDVALAAYAHQDLPFGKLVEALHPERDLSRAPIIQVVLLLLDGAVLSPRLADLELETVDVYEGNARYDVMFAMWDHPELFQGWYEFNADLWDRTTAGRLVEGFYRILDAMLADPDRRLSDVAWVSPAEAHQVLAEWNDTAVGYSTGMCLHELVAAQAAAREREAPGAIAATFEGDSLTYAELRDRARGLARHLAGLGVTPDARVGVRMERSLDMIVALLGTLEAGAAYVPLDPDWPAERLKLVLESAGLAAMIDRVDLTDPTDPTDPSDLFDPDLAAYVIFTSGSTGIPKGVVVPHRGIVNRLLWMQEAYGLTPEDRVLQKTPFGFDVSVWEFFWPLLAGARLVFARPEGHKDPRYLAELIAREKITTLHFVPSMLQVFLETLESPGAPALPSLRLVMASGEALPPELVRRFHALLPGVELHNLYGPTEASVDVSFWPCEPAPARVPIGRPIGNLRLHVVDRNLRAQPIGVPGELLLGGVGLARGYLGRPELTAAAFVPDPFGEEPGSRLYRTGDLVRTLADGNVEFLGRIDHQVKIRGVRIELGEVEAVLGRHPAVGECVAAARDGELVAYVVGRGGPSPDPEELRRFLLERLPEAMVPSAFVVLDALPLSANGKVDRRALPAPERSRDAAGAAYMAPGTPEEELLAGLWEKVLGIERPGVQDHFFAVGGHSLLATRLTLYIRDAFAVDLPVRAIFQAPTIAAQAELIAALRAGGDIVESGRIEPLPRGSWPLRAPLSFAQERLWFLDRLMPGSPAYNLAVALRLDGRLDARALADAFRRLVERHEALRTALPEREGRPVQEVAATGAAALQEIDLSGSASPEADARRLAEADALRPFDLAAGPLLRATLLRLGPEGHVLLLAMHHIVSDAWSMGVLVDDLTALYAGRPLPELPVQYADYAVWQRERLDGEEVGRQLAFWRDQLAGAPPFLDLPTDRPRPAVQSLRGGMVAFDLDAETSAALAGLTRQRGATLYMSLLAGWGALLGRLADQRDLVLGTAVANRDRPEVERLIGFFVNTLAMRVDLAGSPSFEELLGRLRHRMLDAFSHRDLPFEKLVEELHPARDRSRQPIFQAMLTFQNVPAGRADLAGLTLTPLEVEAQTTKFDLTLTLFEEGGRVLGWLEYAGDLFDRSTAERWAGGFARLLAGAAAAPGTRVAELPLVSPEELRQVLVEPNRTAASYPRDASLGALFVEQASRHPTAVVLEGEEETTWAELERRSERIARRLVDLGVGLDARVGLVADRTPGLIAGLLGIVRAGGAYVPLDPLDPPERLARMLADSGARLLLAERRLLDGLPQAALPAGVEILPLDEAEEGVSGVPETPLPLVPSEALAYVMYTSGSTGTPKGVAVTHRNVIRLVRGSDYADLGPEQVWLQAAPVSFDASTLEIWAPLLSGGRLVLMTPGRASLDDLAAAIARSGVTSLWLTAGLFHQMVEHRLDGLRPLRQLLAGGDVVAPEAARRVLESLPGLVLIDGYGPTEGTTFTCCHRVTGKETGAAVPIGRPIANARVYVVAPDEGAFQPVPAGVAGELYAGGDGLARGYLDSPDLTAERFVPDPFSGLPGERLYRTGDRVRWMQGDLAFLGRLDGQVKIRGFRVETGEVEAALAGHPAVRQAAVLPREHPGGRILAAYAALSATASAAELQRFLRERLPEAMIPSAWMFLEELPLTPNGKVDRRALAALEVEAARTASERVPPRNPTEERLVAAVAGVLGLEPERIGVYDNFFDLGGHSLLATQLVAQLRQQHGIDVSLPLLFDSVHLADLADQITTREIEEADDALLEEILAELEEPE